MHQIIQEGLEDYLVGRVPREVEVHLEQCVGCRQELAEMASLSLVFRKAFDFEEGVEPGAERIFVEAAAPSPSFYPRLLNTIETQKTASPWAFFSIDAVFGRRVAFASLLTLALVGSFLISRESDQVLDPQAGPVSVIAQQDPADQDGSADRDRMMVTLASYRQ